MQGLSFGSLCILNRATCVACNSVNDFFQKNTNATAPELRVTGKNSRPILSCNKSLPITIVYEVFALSIVRLKRCVCVCVAEIRFFFT